MVDGSNYEGNGCEAHSSRQPCSVLQRAIVPNDCDDAIDDDSRYCNRCKALPKECVDCLYQPCASWWWHARSPCRVRHNISACHTVGCVDSPARPERSKRLATFVGVPKVSDGAFTHPVRIIITACGLRIHRAWLRGISHARGSAPRGRPRDARGRRCECEKSWPKLFSQVQSPQTCPSARTHSKSYIVTASLKAASALLSWCWHRDEPQPFHPA
jgi:hypothetical protein